jgi:hypothetical protein
MSADREILLAAIKVNGNELYSARLKLKIDKDFVLQAVKLNSNAFLSAPYE